MESTTERTRRTYYLWACTFGLLTTALLTAQSLMGNSPERLYFLVTQPLIALFCVAAAGIVYIRRRTVMGLERAALVIVTLSAMSRLPFDLLYLGHVPAGADGQLLIGLVMCAVMGFLTLGSRAATGFVATLYLTYTALMLLNDLANDGPWLNTLATQLALGTLLLLLASLFRFRIGYAQASSDRDTLQSLALTDALTGLLNRRGGERTLNSLSTGNDGYLLALADVDDFKALNDQFGHPEGDRVLCALADGLRRADFTARWGGEEFLIILTLPCPQASAELKDLTHHTHQRVSGLLPRPITLSMGATWVEPGQPWQDALQEADLALYRAKAAGKNRIEFTHTCARNAPHTQESGHTAGLHSTA
ncbi:hypothetical protein GCM10008959_19500 [Deinococcus seoulensis]|uniref:GGDEF domain-containing protein n=2 Tax=Deinococcus TaxID=1298 RepID=A0ABQ2RSQ9_9DEIO|nr:MULTISPECIES: diguanylate cyclase [Deinococcus]GGR57902.1 hypothetical protein GCM10008959_19500 [Deinococcus seoulensis]GGS23103.1 hypothetical protein GCM10008961_13380 [Deinococcus knuensis]